MPKPNGAGCVPVPWQRQRSACGSRPPRKTRRCSAGLIQANTAHTTRVEVRRTSVTGFVDGKEYIRHQTHFGDLTCDNARPSATALLAVACDDPTVFHFVLIVEITARRPDTLIPRGVFMSPINSGGRCKSP